MEAYLYEEKMEDTGLNDERECHWRMFFLDNEGGVYSDKIILHDRRWYLYMNDRLFVIKGGYCVDVSGSGGKKAIWEVLDDHVVEDPKENYEIELQGFLLINLYAYEGEKD